MFEFESIESHRSLFVFLTCAAFALVGCSSDHGAPLGASTDAEADSGEPFVTDDAPNLDETSPESIDPDSENGDFSLSVDFSGYWPKLRKAVPSSGNRWWVVEVTLTNDSVTDGISLDRIYFRVVTSDGVSIDASESGTTLPQACAAGARVELGGRGSCALAFELPTTSTATTLVYGDHYGHVASVDVDPGMVAVAPCDPSMGNPMSSSSFDESCTLCAKANCLSAESKLTTACDAGVPACIRSSIDDDQCSLAFACSPLGDCTNAILSLDTCAEKWCAAQCTR